MFDHFDDDLLDQPDYRALEPDMVRTLDRYARYGEAIQSHFLRNLVKDSLQGVMAHADQRTRSNLSGYTKLVYNRMPSGCWGSETKMEEWTRKGGLEGLEEEIHEHH